MPTWMRWDKNELWKPFWFQGMLQPLTMSFLLVISHFIGHFPVVIYNPLKLYFALNYKQMIWYPTVVHDATVELSLDAQNVVVFSYTMAFFVDIYIDLLVTEASGHTHIHIFVVRQLKMCFRITGQVISRRISEHKSTRVFLQFLPVMIISHQLSVIRWHHLKWMTADLTR